MTSVTLRNPKSEDGEQLLELYKEAFGIEEKNWDDYVKKTDYDYNRGIVVCEDENIVSHARSYDFKMFLRGTPIRVGGIADVATLSEYRRKGYAKLAIQRLLQNDFEEERGGAILYPFLTEFYQKLGWEAIGTDLTVYLNPRMVYVPKLPDSVKLEPLRDSNLPEVMEFYENVARRKYSLLLRSKKHWKKRLKRQLRNIVIREDGRVVGYFLIFKRTYIIWEFPHWKGRVVINEWMAETPNAVKAIFWYIHSWINTTTELLIRVPSLESLPFRLFLRDNDFKISSNNGLMGRVVSLEGLFSNLKWPKGLTGKLVFNVKDELLPQNNGTWELIVEDGESVSFESKSNVMRKDHLKMDIRYLSGIVFGSYTAHMLYNYGLIKVNSTNIREILSLWEKAFPKWPGFMFDTF